MIKTRRLVVLAAALALTVPALGQEASQPSAATLAELRTEAHRLTFLAQVPEAGRAEAEALLSRAEALQQSARDQQITRLEAYVAALRDGDSPSVAEEVASTAVGEGAVEFAKLREALQTDIAAFREAYPEVATSLHRGMFGAGMGERLGNGRFGGMQESGGFPGRMMQMRPGAGGQGEHGMSMPYGMSMHGRMSMPDGFELPGFMQQHQQRQSAP